MNHNLFILLLILAVPAAGDFKYKKSAKPWFTKEEWISDISETKMYDDDIVVGKMRINRSEALLDTLLKKMKANAGRSG